MSVYIGPMRTNHLKHPRQLPRSCHVMADSEMELELFARTIGLRKDWKHGDHYDISVHKRGLALAAGAMQVSDRWLVNLRKKLEGGK